MHCSGRKCLDLLQLFQRLDSAKVGSIPLSQMKRYFRGNAHPDVTGERGRTAGEVEAALIELFQTRRTPVHRSQPAQMVSWAVSGGGGEWEDKKEDGRDSEERMTIGTCCAMCLIYCRSLKTTLKGRASNFLLRTTSLLWSRLVGPFDHTSLS